MARTLGVAALPALLVLAGWLRLEEPRAAGADWVWAALLALVPALPRRLWLRLALVPPAALTALWVALDRQGSDDRRGFFEPVALRLADGVEDFYDVAVPFAGGERPHMHGAVVLAIFAFVLVLAQFVAARRPLPAVLVLVAGAGWPAALNPSGSVAYGAVLLAAALWVLAGLRLARPVPALAAGAALVAAAAALSTTAAVAKDGVLAWETWDPNGATRAPISVAYVWEAQYGGIEFPKQPTTVLRIRGPQRGHYWRATTLDSFTADRWVETPVLIDGAAAAGRLPEDPLLPERAQNPRTWVTQEVEVVALRDSRIVGAAQPVSLEGDGLGELLRFESGLVRVATGLARKSRYTVRSFAPRPAPADLADVQARYPEELTRFLDVGRTRVQPFGRPGRDEAVDAIFRDARYTPLWPYEEMWQQAKRLRAGARTPYGAVVAIETWLRTTGGFVYEEQPPPSGALPPLAHFVASGKAGYCQHFAGAMALMLRFLGIPARVAAGFTSGEREDGAWTVDDNDAHTWVEVWFDGFGWLAFDPTPGRGTLAGTYSASSAGFNAGDAAGAFERPEGAGGQGGAGELGRLLELKERLAERQGRGVAARDESRSVFWTLLLAAVAGALALGAAKLARRKLRYLTRDPRRQAGAARLELAEFLADQGIAVGRSSTPGELRALVHRETGVDAGAFAAALATARFGPPQASAAAAIRARRELRRLLRTLRRRLGRPARLRGLVAIRSLRA